MTNSKRKAAADVWAQSPRAAIIELVADRAAPVWNGERSRSYEVPPWMTPGARQLLIDRGHIRDCSVLPLTWEHIERYLVRITGGKGQAASALRSLLGFTDIVETAQKLATIATTHADFVVAALEGRLESAALAIPPEAIGDLDRDEAMDLLEAVARGHVAANMMRAARIAFRRLFEPTGDASLDDNHGAVVTVASAADRLNRKTRDVTYMLKLEREARNRTLTRKQIAAIDKLGVTEEAEALKAELELIYGDGFQGWYEDMIALVRRWTGYIRRSSALLRDAKALKKQALHLMHGPEALPVFYLSTLHAVAWTRDDHDTPSALRLALEAAAGLKMIVAPDTHKIHAMEARQPLFLLRNLVVRDSRAFVHRNAGPASNVDSQIAGEYARQNRLHSGQEPFKIPLIAQAAHDMRKWVRDNPFGPGAMAIRAEMRGTILVQLRA